MDYQLRRLFHQYLQSRDPSLLCPLVFSLARLHPHLDAEELSKEYPQLPPADLWDCLHNYPLGMTSYVLSLFDQQLKLRGFQQRHVGDANRVGDRKVIYPHGEISQLCFYTGDPRHVGLVHPRAETLQDDLEFHYIWAFNLIPRMPISQVEKWHTVLYYEHHPDRMANPYLMWGAIGVTDNYSTPSSRVYFNPFVMTPAYAEKIFDVCYQVGISASMGDHSAQNNRNYEVVDPPEDLS